MKFKIVAFFNLLVSAALIGWFLYTLEEEKWERKAIKAGVGEYDKFQDFQFKSEKQIFLEFATEEMEAGRLKIETKESEEKSDPTEKFKL